MEALRKLTKSYLETTDHSGSNFTVVASEIRDMNKEMRAGFEKLNEEMKGANTRLESVENRLESLESEMRLTREETTELLRMIVKNTAK